MGEGSCPTAVAQRMHLYPDPVLPLVQLQRARTTRNPKVAGSHRRSPQRRIDGADRRRGRSHSPALLTAWPPNWFRSAALTLAANDSSWREAKRAKRDSVITGAGTSSSIAAWTVQRPSPESWT